MKENSILLRARVPELRYRKAEKVLKRLGMNPGDAVNLLLAQIELRQGLPFDVTIKQERLLSPQQQMQVWTEGLGEY
ncbi:MAG: type II toxin-antitoxin system RelB/DinJ family antitoxin [Akkermansiaceae bacterium]|jgi:addiction module RelB/DinJ family antitoxin